MNHQDLKLTRRDHVKLGMLGAGSLALPGFAIGQSEKPANAKLNIAMIGGGGIAKTAFGDCKKHNVVAIADVDDVSGALGFNAFPNAKRFKDFRKLIDAHHQELDLVIVSTPDHTHFAATYAAMERGIAVHTQKPLTHNIWQARALREAAEKFGVQTVMGNQGHNYEGMRLIKDWYDAGLAGDVREVHAWSGRSAKNNINEKISFPAQVVPATLDWDLWQGPCAERPYNETYCPKGWRWHWDYGTGVLGDVGCHTLDIPVYVMGLGYPTAVYRDDSIDFRSEFDGKPLNSEAATVVYEFPAEANRPSVKVFWYEGGKLPKFPESILSSSAEEKKELAKGGCMLVGSKNTIFSPGMKPTKPRMMNDWEEISRDLPAKTTPRPVGNPVAEIIAAIQGDIPKCGSNFDYAASLTEVVMLGVIAMRSRKKVVYDPETMTMADPALNAFIKEPVRKGWEYGEAPNGSAGARPSLSLFNGTDLTGWTYKDSEAFTGKTESTDKRYSVNDGIFTVNPGEGIQKIWTTEAFGEDFVLKLEFRAGVNADSGIYIRGPQLQCRDYLVAGPYKELKKYKPQDWNQIEVVVKGRAATCTCNGELLAFDKELPPKGPIGLEADRGQMEYRNIKITLTPSS